VDAAHPRFRSLFRMPRPLTGRIIERRLMDGRRAFDVKIRERQMLVGYAPDWDCRRVEHLLRTVLVPRATLNEAWWDELAPSVADAPVRDRDVSFREAASEYVSRLQGQYSNDATLNAYISPVMKHIGPVLHLRRCPSAVWTRSTARSSRASPRRRCPNGNSVHGDTP
jgi:hypothetical protein